MQTVDKTVISEYANSPATLAVIQDFNAWLDPMTFSLVLVSQVWDLQTAVGYGLDVWGRIVGVSRVLTVATSKYLGFDEATSASADPFGQSPLYAGVPSTSNYALSDSAFRTLIYAKALANIWDGSTPGLNKILLTLFPGRGNCYVEWTAPLSITLHFTFALTQVEDSIVVSSGIIPIPAAVAWTVA